MPRRRTPQAVRPAATIQQTTGSRYAVAEQPEGSHVSMTRVWAHKSSRFNPIKDLTSQVLRAAIDDFNRGYIRPFALIMDAIQNRDDVLRSVISKRKLAVARREIEVVAIDDSPEAEKHKESLEYFWANSTATDALELNRRGGPALLVQQMMDAHAKRYAVHELIWRPTPDGMTCQFHFVPLWWFENYTGELRYLPHDLALYGDVMAPGEWMVTVGDHLMEACSVGYLLKSLSMRDWTIYNEKHASPGIVGKTGAAKGSAKWEEMKEAVADVAADFSVVVGLDDSIDAIHFSAQGQLPYGPLIERMDRAMSAIWRGADLSTMSAGPGHGQGASLQGEESDLMESGDALLLSETLNMQVETRVIAFTFGEGVKPLAYGRIAIPTKQDVDSDIKVDEFLIKSGTPVAVSDLLERYGRPRPDKGEELVEKQQPPMFGAPDNGNGNGHANGNGGNGNGKPLFKPRNPEVELPNESMENRMLLKRAHVDLAKAQAEVLAPIRERIAGLLEMTNEFAFEAALDRLRDDLPGLLKEINADPKTADVIANTLTASIFNGRATAAAGKSRLLRRPPVHPGMPRSLPART